MPQTPEPHRVLAQTVPVFSLRGWGLRWIDLGSYETGILLHRDAFLKEFAGPLHRPLLVWDDLIPGVLIDRRRLMRIHTSPFLLTLTYPGLATSDGCVLGRVDLLVRVDDPAQFSEKARYLHEATLDTPTLALAIQQGTSTALADWVGKYAQDDLCYSQKTSIFIASQLRNLWENALGEWGITLVQDPTLHFLPQSKVEARMERVGAILQRRGVLTAEEWSDLVQGMALNDPQIADILSDALDEVLENWQQEGTPGGLPPAEKEPLSLRLLMALSLMPLLLGTSTGSVLGHTQDEIRSIISQSIPFINPALLGGMGGLVVTGPLSLLTKLGLQHLWKRGSETRRQREKAKALLQEARAWALVEMERLRAALERAMTALHSALGRGALAPEHRPIAQEALTALGNALALQGSGFPPPRPRQSLAPREGYFTARLALDGQMLSTLAQRLDTPDLDAESLVGGIKRLAQDTLSTLREWQTYIQGLGRTG